MTDREKILKAAKCCLTGDPMRCPNECPYLAETGFSCGLDPFLADVIAYLGPMKPNFHIDNRFYCGQCGRRVYLEDNYCSCCGRKIKWGNT